LVVCVRSVFSLTADVGREIKIYLPRWLFFGGKLIFGIPAKLKNLPGISFINVNGGELVQLYTRGGQLSGEVP